jgi:hypothetical protein
VAASSVVHPAAVKVRMTASTARGRVRAAAGLEMNSTRT